MRMPKNFLETWADNDCDTESDDLTFMRSSYIYEEENSLTDVAIFIVLDSSVKSSPEL
jgi:hypothetical protein